MRSTSVTSPRRVIIRKPPLLLASDGLVEVGRKGLELAGVGSCVGVVATARV